MLTLVRNETARPSSRPSVETASLTADYLAFDRRRTSRRQYTKAFGGMAIVVLLGAAFGRVPADEAVIVAGLLSSPPLLLLIVEACQQHRLVRRLNRIRLELQAVRKS